jgi:hypothetical protein
MRRRFVQPEITASRTTDTTTAPYPLLRIRSVLPALVAPSSMPASSGLVALRLLDVTITAAFLCLMVREPPRKRCQNSTAANAPLRSNMPVAKGLPPA